MNSSRLFPGANSWRPNPNQPLHLRSLLVPVFLLLLPNVQFVARVLPLLCCGTHYSKGSFMTLKVEFPLQCLARSSSGWCDDMGDLCTALILLHHFPGG